MFSLLVAIAASAVYVFCPDEFMQMFDMLQAFVMKWMTSTRAGGRASDLDIDDFDDSDRIEL